MRRPLPASEPVAEDHVRPIRNQLAEQQRISLNLLSSVCFGSDGWTGVGNAVEASARRERAAAAGAIEAILEVIEAYAASDHTKAAHTSKENTATRGGSIDELFVTALRALGRVCVGRDVYGAERRVRAIHAGAVKVIMRSLDVHARRIAADCGHAFGVVAQRALPILRLLCGDNNGTQSTTASNTNTSTSTSNTNTNTSNTNTSNTNSNSNNNREAGSTDSAAAGGDAGQVHPSEDTIEWWRHPEYEMQAQAHPAVIMALEHTLALQGPMLR